MSKAAIARLVIGHSRYPLAIAGGLCFIGIEGINSHDRLRTLDFD
jgi:hypothetical protein